MQIAGHAFDNHGRYGCGRAWLDIRNTAREEIGQTGIAHAGSLTESEYEQIATKRDAENMRFGDATAAVAAGAGY